MAVPVGAWPRQIQYRGPGADRGEQHTLAEGDLARVCINGCRSRCGEGPDVLNGHHGVITALGGDRSVEVTWRTAQRLPDGTRATASAWMTPADIASGTPSLGYAMTVAASLGMTCDTALLYGHGANAFSTHPGRTRGRKANRLWLRSTSSRTSGPRPSRGPPGPRRSACTARSRRSPATWGSSARTRWSPTSRARRLSPPSPGCRTRSSSTRPAAPPRPPSNKPAGRSSRGRPGCGPRRPPAPCAGARRTRSSGGIRPAGERPEEERFWTERPYGTQTDEQLAAPVRACLAEAPRQDILAAKPREDYEELRDRLARQAAEGLTRGAEWVAEAGAVRDTALGHLKTAIEEAGRARWAAEAERWARAVLPALDWQMEPSWLTLRFATDSSRKEVNELREHCLAQARARRASDDARAAAWRTLTDSPPAQALGVTGPVPVLDELPKTLAEMRETVSQHARRIDARDETALSRLSGTIRSAAAETADWRWHAALAVAEQ
ncbi:hypothetical protein [Streptomyces sp. NE5-10]|uniref:hypothetical protein n=1 Tax=Streptomyces sp. NE5-10 TaxID=2759674 RepID=UPI001903C116|nr:hypothetical protein [Streptomyces sp. NE5-10]